MNKITRSALVAYSSRQMFELVNNVEDYPRFLPWCNSSHIVRQTESELEATVEIKRAGLHKNFTTRNTLYPYERMEIHLVSGPFRHFEGVWTFQPLASHACKVMVELEFEFSGSVFDKLFQPVFNHIANSLVEAFCKRAVEIYGQE